MGIETVSHAIFSVCLYIQNMFSIDETYPGSQV